MNIFTNKLELVLRSAELKLAAAMGYKNKQQQKLEQIVGLHVRLQVAQEQIRNEQLFSTL